MIHPAFFPFFFVIPLFWIVLIVVLALTVGRRWRHRGWGGPGQYGPWGYAARSAEHTLAQRFANGDIDEQEYRARLEVLRTNQVPGPR